MATDRSGQGEGRILIGGPGRSGTTLLVQYFTALGFDTGYTVEQALSRVDPIANAGLENPLSKGDLPYVAKSPYFGQKLARHLDRGDIEVKCCIIPVRELFAAAESRRFVADQAGAAGKDPLDQPGGLTFGAKQNPRRQEQKVAVQLYKVIHALLRHDIPIHFLKFPEFARGDQDLFGALRPLLAEHGVTEQESQTAFERVVDRSRIHDFKRK